jgi:hypothetical protein
MTYYEKLVRKINLSMKQHPHSAMVLDMSTLQIIAKGPNVEALNKKLKWKARPNTLIFKSPNQGPSWIL